jgi:hydrogenase-4 component B
MTTFRLLEFAGGLFVAGAFAALATHRSRRTCGWLSVAAVGGAAILLLWVAVRTFTSGPDAEVSLFPIRSLGSALTLYVDPLSALFLTVAGPIAFLATLYSVEYMGRYTRDSLAKYYPVLLSLFLGIVGTVVTTDLFWFLVFWELMTLSSFFLVGFERESQEAQRAALKYFVVNQAAALGMVAAALVLWRQGGSFHFEELRQVLGGLLQTNPVLAHVVLFLFFLGFATKAGILPMGSWLPDAYPAAPSSATAAFGGTMTKLGIYGLLRVFLHLLPLSSATTAWGGFIAIAGLASLFVGTLTALKQDDCKRLMSFHVIGQVGYMFFGIGMGLALLRTDPVMGALGLLAGLFHMVNHSLYKSCLFLGAGAVEYRTGTRSLAAMPGGLGVVMAVTAGCALMASLAIAGVPPLNGFASKWMMYATGILGGRTFSLLPVGALVAMFISLVTLASFLKYLGGAFLGAADRTSKLTEVPSTMLAPQVVLALACLGFGLVPLFPLAYVHQAVTGLPSAAAVPALSAMFGNGPGLDVSGAGGWLASWAPIPVTLALVVLGLVLYYAVQRAGEAPVRDVAVWTCGENEAPEALRYRAGSFYRPFKEAFRGIYPHVPVPRVEFPAFLRRTLELDRWFYFPLARSAERAARGASRTHVGVLQVYVLWIILGAVAVTLILLLAGGAP